MIPVHKSRGMVLEQMGKRENAKLARVPTGLAELGSKEVFRGSVVVVIQRFKQHLPTASLPASLLMRGSPCS
jgi:hypothetical protein